MLPQRFSSDQAIHGQIRRWQLDNPDAETTDTSETMLTDPDSSAAQTLLDRAADYQAASSATRLNGPKNNPPNKGLLAANASKAARITQERKDKKLEAGSIKMKIHLYVMETGQGASKLRPVRPLSLRLTSLLVDDDYMDSLCHKTDPQYCSQPPI